MNLEKLMFKKISLWILIFTIVLSILFSILFGSLVLRSKTAKTIAMIPQNVKELLLKSDDDFVRGDKNSFKNRSGLIKNTKFKSDLRGFILLSRYDHDERRSFVELISIDKNRVIHTWKPNIKKINSLSNLPKNFINVERDNSPNRYRMFHPYLNSDGSLITHSESPLIKINICSELEWVIDGGFHHSNEKDFEGNFWIPSWSFPINTKGINLDINESDISQNMNFFHDDEIVKISSEGKILFKKTIISILRENGLESLIFPTGENKDPLHLNDIQPVIKDTQYWKKGDVFISLRNISMVFLYRPSENKILWYSQGPWVFQHDVDIINETEISVFDNNLDNFTKSRVDGSSSVVIFDFKTNEFRRPFDKAFVDNNAHTLTGGLHALLKNGDVFVELTDSGRLMRVDKKGNIKWEYINRASNNNIYLLNWSRYYENLDEKLLNSINNKSCD